MSADSRRIDEYARSMFAFDRPHRAWIETCARYLGSVFGEKLIGSTVLDYAFGRGNWSLAALKAGARKVVAIDASETNVRNLFEYCRREGIDGVEVLHGNILEQPIDRAADILWVYGILHHVDDTETLLRRLGQLRRDDSALALVYCYESQSLREAIVVAARRGVIYESERDFAYDSFLFTPAARLRSRDDLTAPFIAWRSQHELISVLRSAGFIPIRAIRDYGDWLRGSLSREFSPHLLICAFSGDLRPLPAEEQCKDQYDIAAIADLASVVMSIEPADTRKRIAIGLVNTHFTTLASTDSVDQTLVQDFLYLMHCLLRLQIGTERLGLARDLLCAALGAMNAPQRDLPTNLLAASVIARHLHSNTIRF